jgi:hypothetical protein
MDFSSVPDCLLFTARTLASALYCIKSDRYSEGSVENATLVADVCVPIIESHDMTITIDDSISGVSTQITWPTGEITPLPTDEPRYWADQFAPGNWYRSDLKRDLEKALRMLQ